METSGLPLEEANVLFADGEPRKALNLLLNKRGKVVLEPKEIVLEAQIQSFLGKYEEAALTLMRLAYVQDPIDRNLLEDAEKLLGGGASDTDIDTGTWTDFMVNRVRFLKMALTMKRGEQAIIGNTTLAGRLELLEKKTAVEKPLWLQRHLVPS